MEPSPFSTGSIGATDFRQLLKDIETTANAIEAIGKQADRDEAQINMREKHIKTLEVQIGKAVASLIEYLSAEPRNEDEGLAAERKELENVARNNLQRCLKIVEESRDKLKKMESENGKMLAERLDLMMEQQKGPKATPGLPSSDHGARQKLPRVGLPLVSGKIVGDSQAWSRHLDPTAY